MYPVDLPAVSDTDLTSASEQYLSLMESVPHKKEWFQLSQTSKVAITTNNVRPIQLFEDDQTDCILLALHPPDDPAQVVALYLHEKWWHVDDVLRTSNKSRSGLISVESIMERVIVFLLSQVVERSSQDKVLFSLHPRTESCKLLWTDSQAVGFYTVKHKDSLCDRWGSRCYLLPALDTVLVRRSWRRRGFGVQMLEDFCSSFSTEEFLGVSSPLSPSMVAVCRSFLQQHQEHLERLYEVEAPGDWTQRRNIWLGIKLGRYSLGNTEESSSTSDITQRNEEDSPQKATALGGSRFHQKMLHCHHKRMDMVSNNTWTYNCSLGLTSLSTCNVKIPLVIKPCDPSRGEGSPSSKTAGAGCSCAADASDQGSGSPISSPWSQNTKQALKSKYPISAEPHRKEQEGEETKRQAKQIRRA